MTKVEKATLQTAEQKQLMQLINDALVKGEGPLADIFGGFNKQEFEEGVTQPALKNFQDNILPQIQEKFIAGNQVGGSGMRRGQLKAATDLQSQLAALLYQAQQQQKQNRIGGVNSYVGQKTFENIVPQASPSAASQIIPAVGTAVGGFLGGPAGAAIVGGGSKAVTDAVVG